MTDKEKDAIKAAADVGIRIDCPLPGHEGEFVVYKRRGWKYSHRRKVDHYLTGDDMVNAVLERLLNWHLVDEDGNDIPFVEFQDPEAAAKAAYDRAVAQVKAGSEPFTEEGLGIAGRAAATLARIAAAEHNLPAIDDVPPDTATWLLGTFMEAYQAAANPFSAKS